MPNLGGWEVVLLAVLVVLLFGAKRLPDAARGVGRSLRIFKAEIKGGDDQPELAANPPVVPPPASQPIPSVPVQGSQPFAPAPTPPPSAPTAVQPAGYPEAPPTSGPSSNG